MHLRTPNFSKHFKEEGCPLPLRPLPQAGDYTTYCMPPPLRKILRTPLLKRLGNVSFSLMWGSVGAKMLKPVALHLDNHPYGSDNHFILVSPIANTSCCPCARPHSCRVVYPQTLRALNFLTPGSGLSAKGGHQEHPSPPRSYEFFFW